MSFARLLFMLATQLIEQRWRMECIQAQPTQRRKTTSVLRPPSFNLPSLSTGAVSPTLGTAATATGGGGGASHGCTVNGRLKLGIQDDQPSLSSS